MPHAETSGAQSPAIIAGGSATVTYGLKPEEVRELTKAAAAGAVGPLTDKIVDLSSKLGVTQGSAITLLRIIGQQDVPFEKLPQKIAEVAEQYKSAMARVAALDPQDPVAQAEIKAGHLDEADQLVSQAEQAELVAAHQAQQPIGYGASSAGQPAPAAASTPGAPPPAATVHTEGNQSPAIVSGGGASVQYAPPTAPK